MDNIYLREADINDIYLLFEWANDIETRKNAFSTSFIPFEVHEKWYKDKLSSNLSYLYLYYCNDKPIGQVRIDIEGENAIIDYSICKECRGRGHGKRMLLLIEDKIKKEFVYIQTLTARVKNSNLSSQKVIEDLDYERVFIEYKKSLKNDLS